MRWHLLSLDAPSVSTAWTWLVARACHLRLPGSLLAAMFTAVFVIYASDRLLDASRGRGKLEARHRFHARHRGAFKVAIMLGLAALVPLIAWMPALAREAYAALGALLLSWFAVIHLLARGESARVPKELVVGVFFAAAVTIPTLAAEPGLLRLLLVPAVVMGNMCSLNCLFIYRWEHCTARDLYTHREDNAVWPVGAPLDSAGVRSSDSHRSTRLGLRLLVPIAAASCLLPLALVPLTDTRVHVLLEAASASAFLLLLLHAAHARIAATTLRALADVALLTPLLTVWLL